MKQEITKETLLNLVCKAQAGDEEAKEEFVKAVLPILYGVAYKTTGDSNLAEEQSNWVAFKLVERIYMFDVNKSPFSYIKTAMKNYCIDVHRSQSKKIESNTITYSNLHDDMLYRSPDQLERSTLYTINELFDAEAREIVHKYCIENKSLEEIAEQLGETSKTIKKVLCKSAQEAYEELIIKD